MAHTHQKRESRTDNRPEALTYSPAVDILETEQELILFADMPGVKPEELDVRFDNGELRLRGRCTATAPEQPLLEEYRVGDYFRAFSVTEDVNADKISAELKNGVLTVHLPKAEKLKPRKIQVAGV
jgi:HSP20 family protein